MSFSIALCQDVLDHLVGNAAWTAPANIFVGLSSTTPAEDGTNVTEPSAGAYARVSTAAVDWNSATAADPSVVDNANEVTFPTATADWLAAAALTHFVLYDAITAGNFLGSGALTVPKPVVDTDTAKFSAGSLNITLD